MKRLYLIRHGRTDLNGSGCYYGRTDVALNEKGRADCDFLKNYFADKTVDAVYSSPLLRAKETALAAFGRIDYLDDRLVEIDFGDWEGKRWEMIADDDLWKRWCTDWQGVAPGNGESFNDEYRRVRSFCDSLIEEQKEKTIAVVTHKSVVVILLLYILGVDPKCYWSFTADCGSVAEIAFTEGKAVLVGYNVKKCRKTTKNVKKGVDNP